jgi:hypothetical protein
MKNFDAKGDRSMTSLRPSRRPAQLLAALVLTGLVLIGAPASAGPILSGEWLEFGFTTAGTPATGCDPDDPAGPFCIPSSGTPTSFLDAPAWTFTAPTEGALLTVTDAFSSGDRFQLFDFGVSLGLTSLPAAAGSVDCGDDPVTCLATIGISRGFFNLAAGNHSLTLIPTVSLGGGSGYLRVDAAAVPEPATLLLVATGFALTTLRRARSRR